MIAVNANAMDSQTQTFFKSFFHKEGFNTDVKNKTTHVSTPNVTSLPYIIRQVIDQD